MELFFGYIENYSLMTLGVLVYAYLAVLYLRGKTALVWPATALAVTHAFHPSTIVLTPSLLYLAFAPLPVGERNVQGSQDVLSNERLACQPAFGAQHRAAVSHRVRRRDRLDELAGGHGLDALAG